MPRVGKASKPRHNPLYQDILQDDSDSTPRAVKVKGAKDLYEDDEEEYIDSRSSRRVFELAKSQQKEFEIDDSEDDAPDARNSDIRQEFFRFPRDTGSELYSDNEDEDSMRTNVSEEALLHSLDIDVSDLAVLDSLHPSDHVERKTLADIILSKMCATEGETSSTVPSMQKAISSDPATGLDPRIVKLFTKVGQSMLSTGPLPKVIKLLPSFPSWQRYLALTQPASWHPSALRKVTGIFVANMKPRQAQFFFRWVLLPAVREDIAAGGDGGRKGKSRVLNVHYYEALLRAMFKPAPFFKGVVFPLLEENCTSKEAAIVASVLDKKSIPSVHLGAAIVHIAASDFSGPRALFLRVLLDKKKDLPYRVLDDLVFHFIRISNWAKSKKVDLPVLWHQSLLVFSQRYAANLTRDQKDALLDVVKVNLHHQICPEIRRELACPGNRRIDVKMLS